MRSRPATQASTLDDDATGETPIAVAGSLVLPSGSRAQVQESTSVALRNTWVRGSHGFLESTLKILDGSTGNNLDQTERPARLVDGLQLDPDPLRPIWRHGTLR